MKDGRYQILHVEDNEARYINYSRMVSAALNKAGIQHELNWTRSVGDAMAFIVNNIDCLDLILLDISLSNDGAETGLDLVRMISGRIRISIPIFVVSSNVGAYRHVLERLKSEQKIVGYSEPMNEVWTDQLFSILQGKEVSLLHLSDIHEGRFYALQNLAVPANTVIRNLCRRLNKIDFVVISGDISSVNAESDYRNAQNMLNSLKENLDLPASRFVFVPGNHDRDWECTDTYTFSRFLHFLQDFYREEGSFSAWCCPDLGLQDYNNPQTVFDHLFSIAVFPEQKSLVVGFNSVNPRDTRQNHDICCEVMGNDTACGLISGGEISSEQILNVQNELDELYQRHPETKSYTKIAVFHHNIFEPPHIYAMGWQPTLINEGNLLAFLTKYGFRFILHGHLHYAENYFFRLYSEQQGINIISAGTFSGKDQELDSSFCANKITYYVDAEGIMTKPKLRRFTIPRDRLDWEESEQLLVF